MIILLRLIGLDISYQMNHELCNQVRRLVMLIIGLIFVAFSLSVNGIAYIVHNEEMEQSSANNTAINNKTSGSAAAKTKEINTSISMINFLAYSAGVFVIFFLVSCGSTWHHLWHNLQHKIRPLLGQQQLCTISTNRSFYNRCRNAVFVSVFVFLIDCGVNIFMAVDSFNRTAVLYQEPNEFYSFSKRMAVSLSIIAEILPQSVVTLFGILVLITSFLFQHLHAQIVVLLKQLNNDDNSFIHQTVEDDEPIDGMVFTVNNSAVKAHSAVKVLEIWRRQHAAVCQLISQIDHSFGFVLLLAVTNTYVGFINISFEMALAFQDGNSVQTRFVILFFKQMVRTVVITYGPYLIKRDVISFTCFI